MAGTIVVDRIESDASYASTINVAGQITFSNTVNFGVYSGTAPVAGFYLPTTNNLAFTTASTERMRIDSSGNVGIGTSNTPSNKDTVTPKLVVNGSGVAGAMQVVRNTTVGSGGAILELTATRGSDVNSYTILQSGDGVGSVVFGGADGNEFVAAGSVQCQVDGTPGDNDMPGRLTFNTTADGASSPSERMRIDSSGNVGIGTSSPSTYGKLAATGTSAFGVDQTDYINALGGGGTARVEAVGGNTNINLALSTKGTGAFYIWRGGYGGTNTLLIDGSSNLKFNSGYGSAATAYGCRAWVNFNGTGTVAIRSSGNVSSITDGGVGIYRVNFSTGMPDVNYSTTASVAGGGTVNSSTCAMLVNATSTAAAGQTSSVSYVDVFCYHPGNQVAQDNAWINVTVQR